MFYSFLGYTIYLLISLLYRHMTKEEKQMHDFGRRVASLRKYNDYTQHELAELLGVHHTTLARIEIGQRWPKLATLHKMAKVLKIPLKDIFETLR
jgi:DNA-binding XRE family transcriptional regulator